jgi:hypothetical protein
MASMATEDGADGESSQINELSENSSSQAPPQFDIIPGQFKIKPHSALVGGSDHFLRLSGLPNPTLTAAAAALSDLIGHNVPLAVIAGLAAEVAQRYKHLKTDEITVLNVLSKVAPAGRIYKVWVGEGTLLRAMQSDLPDLSSDDHRRLLASMKSRGVLEEGAGWWRAVF